MYSRCPLSTLPSYIARNTASARVHTSPLLIRIMSTAEEGVVPSDGLAVESGIVSDGLGMQIFIFSRKG